MLIKGINDKLILAARLLLAGYPLFSDMWCVPADMIGIVLVAEMAALAAGVPIAGITATGRLVNAKRTCGGLVDFASKITQARPTVMRDDKPGGTISASVKTKSPCPSDRGYHSADLPSGLRCDPAHILACRSVIFNRWRRSRSENRYEETSGNRCLAHCHNCRGFLLHGECLHWHLRRISMQPVESNAGPLVRPHRLVVP